MFLKIFPAQENLKQSFWCLVATSDTNLKAFCFFKINFRAKLGLFELMKNKVYAENHNVKAKENE